MVVIVSLERNIQNIKELTNILQSPGLRKMEALGQHKVGQELLQYPLLNPANGFAISKSEKTELQSVALDLVAVLENIPDHPEGGE